MNTTTGRYEHLNTTTSWYEDYNRLIRTLQPTDINTKIDWYEHYNRPTWTLQPADLNTITDWYEHNWYKHYNRLIWTLQLTNEHRFLQTAFNVKRQIPTLSTRLRYANGHCLHIMGSFYTNISYLSRGEFCFSVLKLKVKTTLAALCKFCFFTYVSVGPVTSMRASTSQWSVSQDTLSR
jgi:hypothetical protein